MRSRCNDKRDLLAELMAERRHNKALRQTIRDLKWDMRAMRVQLYAEKTYAANFAEMERRRVSS